MLRLDINILFTVINLIILYLLMKKFLFGRVHKILAAREADIRKQYEDADKTRADADALKASFSGQMQAIEDAKVKALADARSEGEAEKEKILAGAHAESDRIIAAAKQKAQAEADLEKQKAEAVITSMLDQAAKKAAAMPGDSVLYDRFLNETAVSSGTGKAD